MCLFQSTLPVWGATDNEYDQIRRDIISIHAPRVGSDRSVEVLGKGGKHFNPRSPCGERRWLDFPGYPSCAISIHAPRVGSDQRLWKRDPHSDRFQSTLPVWGATSLTLPCSSRASYFNPRSPCGERPHFFTPFCNRIPISIHAPRVGSDSSTAEHIPGRGPISIHAPRVGSDPWRPGSPDSQGDFNPRSPCGERPGSPRAAPARSDFNPRSPCGERLLQGKIPTETHRFQSTLPVWGATKHLLFLLLA